MGRPRTPLAAWIREQRQAREWKSEEVARRLGVAESTVRSWESGRTISDDNLDALERLFGQEAPGHEASAPDVGALAVAIEAQTAAITDLVEALRPVAGPLAQQVADLQWAVQRLYEQAGLGSPKPPVRRKTVG